MTIYFLYIYFCSTVYTYIQWRRHLVALGGFFFSSFFDIFAGLIYVLSSNELFFFFEHLMYFVWSLLRLCSFKFSIYLPAIFFQVST